MLTEISKTKKHSETPVYCEKKKEKKILREHFSAIDDTLFNQAEFLNQRM
jgi:hypothetical protein